MPLGLLMRSGMHALDMNYTKNIKKIKKFHNDYMVLADDLGLSILVKAHEVFLHVAPLLKKWNIPLGVVSAQTSESLHSNFNAYIEQKKRSKSKFSSLCRESVKSFGCL